MQSWPKRRPGINDGRIHVKRFVQVAGGALLSIAVSTLPAQNGKRIDITEEVHGKKAAQFENSWPVFVTEGVEFDEETLNKVIYGTDDRIDWYEETNPARLKLARSTCVLIDPSNITDNGNGTYDLDDTTFQQARGVCVSEPFSQQPVPGDCSGFLVASDIIATAGHCVTSQFAAANTFFVFNFNMVDANTPRLTVNEEDVYRGTTLIGQVLSGSTGEDWALIRVDRPVTAPESEPHVIRRTGTIPVSTNIGVIGHPAGLPSKIAYGADTAVRDTSNSIFFEANLDTYGGNSGSAVFNAATGIVEGILVRGETDYVSNGGCLISNVVGNNEGSGEDVTKTTLAGFNSLIPTLSVVGIPMIDDTAGGDGDGILEPGESNVSVSFMVKNTGEATDTNVGGTISPLDVSVTTGVDSASYGSLSSGQIKNSVAPFTISVDSAHVCGDPVTLEIDLVSDNESTTYTYMLPTGPVCDVVPDLSLAAAIGVTDSAGNGNGSGGIDPGESMVSLNIPLANSGTDATSVMATLSSPTSTVTVLSGDSTYPDIATGNQGANETPFVIGLDPGHACGAPITLQLDLVTTQGAALLELEMPTGSPGQSMQVLRNIPSSVAIVDQQTVFRDIDITEVGLVTDVNATVDVNHTYMEDLTITIAGPGGQASTLIAGRGGAGNDMNNTDFDDSAASSIASGSPPFSGTFRPETPLDVFNGRFAAGTWRFSVSDSAINDQGTMTTNTGLNITYDSRECQEVSSSEEWRIY